MNRMLMKAFAVGACVMAFAATTATTAVADDGTAGDDAQLLDVSKQVAGI